jgi:two-component system NtrC family sensor kinase
MRIARYLGYGFMAAVLAAGWGFLYWQSSALDLESIEGTRTAVAALRELDNGWNQQLVHSRWHPVQGPPSAIVTPQASRHAVALARLEVRALRLGVPGLGSQLTALKQAFDEKAGLVSRYAAARAQAASAVPAAAAEEADALFDQAWYASTTPRLDTLERTIGRRFEDMITQAELYRIALLYYSGFLLAVLAFLAWSLDQQRRELDHANRQLHEANETLEARVAARTHELSEALAKLKESEAMLIQSEKMSSLGQMVAGIAHEVNTPLAYVKASLEALGKAVPQAGRLAGETEKLLALLSSEHADESALASQFATVRALLDDAHARAALEELERMLKDGLFGIEQISEVISNLKNFSRLDRSKVSDYDLHEGIESTLRIGHARLLKRAVRKEFGKIPRVTCSPSQINQVILNLLSNAAQATRDDEGTIIVRTAMRDAGHVAVEVTDNGHGIPAEVLPKIFDPFFTTKPVGKGTGLGLSICYKIVQNHGGRLEVQSKPGVGTRFTMVLPVKPPTAPAV